MTAKKYIYNKPSKFNNSNDPVETYGYDIQNVKRGGKKKVTKFKPKADYYEDSF
jgi:hypothetical protein